jgi:hypothetical protein
MPDLSSIALAPPGPDPEPERQHQDIDELARLRQEREVVDGTLKLLRADAARIGRPRYLGVAVLVLAYFALGGAAFPLSLLAFDPLDNRFGLRLIVFCVLLSGLLLSSATSPWRSGICVAASTATSRPLP